MAARCRTKGDPTTQLARRGSGLSTLRLQTVELLLPLRFVGPYVFKEFLRSSAGIREIDRFESQGLVVRPVPMDFVNKMHALHERLLWL
jgi:hypothetical protein